MVPKRVQGLGLEQQAGGEQLFSRQLEIGLSSAREDPAQLDGVHSQRRTVPGPGVVGGQGPGEDQVRRRP